GTYLQTLTVRFSWTVTGTHTLYVTATSLATQRYVVTWRFSWLITGTHTVYVVGTSLATQRYVVQVRVSWCVSGTISMYLYSSATVLVTTLQTVVGTTRVFNSVR